MRAVRRIGVAGVGLALAVAAGVLACGRPVRGNKTNVLLVTIETTRADHVGAYGYGRDTSPNFDRWARAGALFERHTSVAPRTNPSLASLLTGTYPHEHGTRSILLPLEPEARTLAEILRDAGYATLGVQTHPRLVAASGFGQGFDEYLDDVAAHPLAEQSLALTWERIRDAARGARPWFAWVHVMDPHWTYDPPAPWRTKFGPEDERPSRLYADLAARRRTIGPVIFRNAMPADEVRAFINLYDAEIRYTDEALGRLLDRLRDAGLDRTTLVVVTADHGESLGENGYFFEHGDRGSEPEIHVPLALVLPGRLRADVRVPWTTRSIDIVPTVLDLVGLAPDDRVRGRSLAPMIDGTEVADRICFGETDRSLHEEATTHEVDGIRGKWRWVKRGPWKLVRIPRAGGKIEWLLFDLESDPLETRNLADARPDIVGGLARELEAWIAEDHQEDRDYHVSPELHEQLRSLGYVN